jgi:small subunit ribosomal protein S1
MAENKKNSDKQFINFEDCEITMADLLKDCSKSENTDSDGEREVVIVEENSEGFMVDLGMKFEGIIPKKEFEESKIPPELKVGARIRAKILSTEGQHPVLSYKEIVEKTIWKTLRSTFENGKRVCGTIIKSIKSGFIVDIGVKAFLHISQLDVNFIKDPEHYVGKSYEFMITSFNEKERNITLSRRKIIEYEKDVAKMSALRCIDEGQIIDGKVSAIISFGAFIDLGGIDGLLHINDMAWYRVGKVQDLLRRGQTVKVQVRKVDKSSGKISLSLKSLTPHPWESVNEKFPLGVIVKGTVTSVVNYGAFVELEPGVEGLLHSSEYSWNNSEELLKRELKKGQEIEVKVIGIDVANKKVALSVKRMRINPWDEALKCYPPGSIVKGTVQELVPFGAFVKLPGGIDGLIYINNFSWTKKIKHPCEVIRKGSEVEVIVLEINPKDEKILLSLKHTRPDPYKKYNTGDVVRSKVVKIVDFGVYVELEPDVEALIRNNEIPYVKTSEGKNRLVMKIGEEIEAKIIKVDLKTRKIEASVKKLEFEREKELINKYANRDGHKITLMEILTEE